MRGQKNRLETLVKQGGVRVMFDIKKNGVGIN